MRSHKKTGNTGYHWGEFGKLASCTDSLMYPKKRPIMGQMYCNSSEHRLRCNSTNHLVANVLLHRPTEHSTVSVVGFGSAGWTGCPLPFLNWHWIRFTPSGLYASNISRGFALQVFYNYELTLINVYESYLSKAVEIMTLIRTSTNELMRWERWKEVKDHGG